MDNVRNLSLVKTKLKITTVTKSLHNCCQEQENTPGGISIRVEVNNQEKISPEQIQMIYYRM